MLLAPQERARGSVWDRWDAGIEQAAGPAYNIQAVDTLGDRFGQSAFVDSPRPSAEIRMTVDIPLEQLEERCLVQLGIDRFEPCPQQRAGVLRPQVRCRRSLAKLPLAQHALGDTQDAPRSRPI